MEKNLNIVKDKNEWNSLLEGEFSQYKDIYFRYEYFQLYKKFYSVEPEGILWQDDNIKIFWTHLIRNINKIKQFRDFEYYDLTTPYGYGGPIAVTKTEDKKKLDESLKNFFEEYRDYALKNKYVCEFIRFHPVFGNRKSFNGIFDIEYLNDVVIVDLSKDIDEIWKGIRETYRYQIRKSLKGGRKIEITDKPPRKDIDNFIKIYYETMDKNEVSKKYYVPEDFIDSHFDLFKSIFIKAWHGEKVIGAGIFIYWNKIVHYHFSGTAANQRESNPSKLIIWEAIKWAKENNFILLHLGGGRGKNDTLFDFKRGFSKITMPFYIGRIMFDKKTYDELTTLNPALDASGNYFPSYRQGLDETIV